MPDFDLGWVRSQFPSLSQELNGQPVTFFDGPGGTQVPRNTIAAMSDYLIYSNANAHGAFITSERTDKLINETRSAAADLLGCAANEIVFGANMTTLAFAFSRAIGRELQPGDEIITTKLDHYANISPWQALEEKGVVIRSLDIRVEDCTLDLDRLQELLTDRTKLVAIGYASNAVGTVNDVAAVTKLAHQVGALVFVDAVHYVPHGAIDVQELDCDFLACSAYKFFAPHLGILYGKHEHLSRLQPYKVTPASNDVPSRWETGTQSYEAMAGLVETIDYLRQLGQQVAPTANNRRAALVAGMKAIHAYEQELSRYLLSGLAQIPGLTVYGITNLDRVSERTPTVGIRLEGYSPHELAKKLGERGIFTWNGNFYAVGVTEALGIESSGGLLRMGLVHYNTIEEIDRLLKAIDNASSG
ncbi:cysteine desulfurase-like protein [Chamaesiphon minutus]|uniref:Cysteine desulfurase family protein, VC1184 subfamily n=1 Tax=Chamaesiphon minutus (strain ATCC 27169 / PCC 6605) TaxID=1173020 RepID=K9UHJ5_CHAP6|nr:cysteine desulfurase-like protein [Chamaesiphon minutus]AFY93916.1 cysteine desulfurase family protein, VC1184 subfamily [Chamaesiphon minutus PCC 6605]